MTLKINKSLKEKIAVLEEYFKSNKMDEYLLLSEGQKIAQEEAVYLYNENYFEGLCVWSFDLVLIFTTEK